MSSQIPDIFKNFVNKELKMPGQNGTIKIELQANEDSKTYIKSLLSKAPFLIQKAMYPDTGYPHFAHIYMMSSSGGILQGDEQKIDVAMGRNSAARITTQSATKIYKMEGVVMLLNTLAYIVKKEAIWNLFHIRSSPSNHLDFIKK